MKAQHALLLTTLSASLASAQFLTNGVGSLPSCGQSCAVLTQAQSSCSSSWSCFCETVWKNSNKDIATVCASSCSSATDNTAISTWYTANCGSDNGASEHGSSGGSNNGGGSGAATTSAGTSSSAAASSAPASTGGSTSTCSGWFNCHWKWVVMLIVLFVGLLAFALIGRWLKKRHDRKQDTVREGFNAGITSRGGGTAPPMSSTNNDNSTKIRDSTMTGAGEVMEPSGSGRNSPARTREAFMPYGYGYTRSESRLASPNQNDRGSPLARGGTPVNEMEKGVGVAETPASSSGKKSRRVLVREKSAREDVR